MALKSIQPLLIFPCNGNAVEALDCLGTRYELIGFVDDIREKQGGSAYGYRVFERSALREFADALVLAVPGSPTSYRARKEIITGLGVETSRFARVVHPRANISPLATLGHNVLIMAGVVLTSNAVIGNNVCVLPNTVVHHDAVVGDFSLIGSNVSIAGGAVIGKNCYIGSGSQLMNGVRIGDGALIGLGSNVIHDVPAGVKVAGNPARTLSAAPSHAH